MAQPSGSTPRHAASSQGGHSRQSQGRSAQPRSQGRAAYVPGEVPEDIADLDTAPRASQASGLSSGATMMTSSISSQTAKATRSAQANAGTHSAARRTESRRVSVVALVAVAIVVLGTVAFVLSRTVFNTDNGPQIQSGLEVKVTIPDGAGGEQIASILVEAGVISDSSSFFKELRRQDAEMSLQSGTYEFYTGSNVKEVVTQLASGPNSTADTITIPEGYTLKQIAKLCEEKLLIPYDDFMARAKASNYVNDYPFLLDVTDDSLEGFLFPKTYDFGGREISIDLVIRTMLSQYQAEVADLNMEESCKKLSERFGIEMTPYKALTMASIIEKEAILDEERADVASVFYNRMNSGMPLQSDATMGYVLDHAVEAEDLEIDSPYNTYLNYGLTPTPICNPGIDSIKAALNPNDTKYLYFFIIHEDDYKKHVFSENYDDHLRAIAEAEADLAG